MNNPVVGLILKLKAETGLAKPNADQDWVGLGRQLNDDLFLFGSCLAWKVPSKAGCAFEVRRLEVSAAVPQPRNDDYPDGYYKVYPWGSLGPLSSLRVTGWPVSVDARQVERLTESNELLRYEGTTTEEKRHESGGGEAGIGVET